MGVWTDGQLVRRVRRGDAAAFDVLFARHWRTSFRAALAIASSAAAAEDAAQEAWLRAMRGLDGCRPPEHFGRWLRRIAINCAIDGLRGAPAVALPGLEVASTAHDEDDGLRAAVRALEFDRRIVVALRFWADLTVPEIADALGVPVGTASSRLTRGLADLRSRLAEVERC
jgi:RNA polymerase sigma-70 factor (ECF subfamily)